MGIRENERIVDLGVGLGGDFGQRSKLEEKKRFWNVKGQQTSDLRFRPRHGGNLKPRYQHTCRQTHTEKQSSGTKKWKHRMKNTTLKSGQLQWCGALWWTICITKVCINFKSSDSDCFYQKQCNLAENTGTKMVSTSKPPESDGRLNMLLSKHHTSK